MDTIFLSAVGDVCLASGVRESIAQHGASFPFELVGKEMENSDVRFGNLECVFNGEPRKAKYRSQMWAVDSSIESLKNIRFDIMSFANNHIMDFGRDDFDHTIEVLSKNGIGHIGAGSNFKEARAPAIIERSKMRLGFVAYADDEGQIAKVGKAGAAEARIDYVIKDITELKKSVDVVIVSLHMGIEFSAYPSPYQVRLSRKAVDAGAAVVLGHHPHVLQGIEVYRGSLICYSLGNFLFQVHGHEYLDRWLPYSSWGMILKICLEKSGYVSHTVIPTLITRDHRVSPAQGGDASSISEHLEEISKPLKDIRDIERLYQRTCRAFAVTNYQWLRGAVLHDGIRAGLKRIGMMAFRAPNRRWIAGYLRSLCHRTLGRG